MTSALTIKWFASKDLKLAYQTHLLPKEMCMTDIWTPSQQARGPSYLEQQGGQLPHRSVTSKRLPRSMPRCSASGTYSKLPSCRLRRRALAAASHSACTCTACAAHSHVLYGWAQQKLLLAQKIRASKTLAQNVLLLMHAEARTPTTRSNISFSRK